MKMSNRNCTAPGRLQQDYLRIKRDPVPYITAEPSPSNILEWHYVICGPENTPYEGGYYHGRLVFPWEFPFKPPSIYMITPNGRFRINKNLCLSMSEFELEMWKPTWTVSTLLIELLSFMLEESSMFLSLRTSDDEKRHLALKSLEFNLKNKTFCELFPDKVTTIQETLKQRGIEQIYVANNQTSNRSAYSRFVDFFRTICLVFIICNLLLLFNKI